jgi:hypothetical protein
MRCINIKWIFNISKSGLHGKRTNKKLFHEKIKANFAHWQPGINPSSVIEELMPKLR